jgi:hypothetical protein
MTLKEVDFLEQEIMFYQDIFPCYIEKNYSFQQSTDCTISITQKLFDKKFTFSHSIFKMVIANVLSPNATTTTTTTTKEREREREREDSEQA